MPDQALPTDPFDMLSQANEALQALPAAVTVRPGLQVIGTAVKAGPSRARATVEAAGATAVATALMQASETFRSTGHFHNADLLERLARVVARWERRVNPRRPTR